MATILGNGGLKDGAKHVALFVDRGQDQSHGDAQIDQDVLRQLQADRKSVV